MCILGTLIYRTSIALSLKIGFNPSDLKLISSIIVIVALSLGSGKGMLKKKKILMKEKDKSISKLKKVGSENA